MHCSSSMVCFSFAQKSSRADVDLTEYLPVGLTCAKDARDLVGDACKGSAGRSSIAFELMNSFRSDRVHHVGLV